MKTISQYDRRLLTSYALCSALIVSFFTITSGCATFKGNPDKYQALAKNVTYFGTQLVLSRKPDLRPDFLLAYQSLDKLIKSGKVDGVTISQILEQLPVRELESKDGLLLIQAGSAIFDFFTEGKVDLNQAPNVLAIGTGIRDGLKAGLGL